MRIGRFQMLTKPHTMRDGLRKKNKLLKQGVLLRWQSVAEEVSIRHKAKRRQLCISVAAQSNPRKLKLACLSHTPPPRCYATYCSPLTSTQHQALNFKIEALFW